jgi:hypothetical protein
MPFLPLLIGFFGSMFTGASNVAKSILGFKGEQAKTVQKAIEVVSTIDNNDAATTAALANALQQILTQGSFIEKSWRGWLMVILIIQVVCMFFGYVPPHFNDPLSPMQERIFNLIEIGLGGYIARRGIVDVVRMFNIGSILKELIRKKIV